MRMTAFLLILFFHASAFTESAAQVTLKESSATLEKVLKTIQQQSSYDLVFDKALLQAKAKPVTVNVTNVPVKEALEKVFAQQELLTYTLSGKIISVMERKVNPVMMPIKTEMANIDVRGKVTDENGKPVVGASVQVKGGNKGTTTDENGFFVLAGVDEKATLVISAVNIETREVPVNGRNELNLVAKVKVSQLEDVAVSVNTGYQTIPKERATGSFVTVSNKLFNRRISSDVLSRIQDIVPGVFFNPYSPNTRTGINIRGQSSVSSLVSQDPLIVVDNFPYEGDLSNLNPNDVDNITVLKDAAAASIWGARAANGVIVITTKNGHYNQKLRIETNMNITIVNKPNFEKALGYVGSKDFIGIERYLFGRGFFNSTLSNTNSFPAVSPVVEILDKINRGVISNQDGESQIQQISSYDVRRDYEKYIYQQGINRQLSTNFSGGGNNQSYYFGVGYDDNQSVLVRNNNKRLSLNSTYRFTPLKNLEVSSSINFVQNNAETPNNQGWKTLAGNYNVVTPYVRFANDNGIALAVPSGFNNYFNDSLNRLGFLDWRLRPLDEIRLGDNTSKVRSLVLRASVGYKFSPQLNATIFFQHENQNSESRSLRSDETFSTRNLINSYAQYNASTKKFTYPFPLGDVLLLGNGKLSANNVRSQLNYSQTFGDHSLNALAGAEAREILTEEYSTTSLGYNDEFGTAASVVDYVTFFARNGGLGIDRIPPPQSGVTGTTRRFLSYYTNIGYTFKGRYIFTASGRKDGANIFGVRTNDRITPLWSAGFGWNISQESFYKLKFLPYLKLSSTVGYNGNVYNGSAYLTASYSGTSNITNLPIGFISTPPNSELRWEKVRNINFRADFRSIKDILQGSVELFHKRGEDLVQEIEIPGSTGFPSFQGNAGKTRIWGLDFQLTSLNTQGKFKWQTIFMLSWQADKVIAFSNTPSVSGVAQQGAMNPGGSVTSIYSYRWAGLDPLTGDPRGYLGKDISKDYSRLTQGISIDSLVYHGSKRPQVYGAIRNSLSYGNFSLSFNISYKLKYYFRRPTVSLNYQTIISQATGVLHSDYLNRWQKPGDENITQVPSLVYVTDNNRSNFYRFSEILVSRGDHIRFQDISFTWNLRPKIGRKMPFTNFQINGYINNIGIIWRANEYGIDPDNSNIYQTPNPKTFAIGVKANF